MVIVTTAAVTDTKQQPQQKIKRSVEDCQMSQAKQYYPCYACVELVACFFLFF